MPSQCSHSGCFYIGRVARTLDATGDKMSLRQGAGHKLNDSATVMGKPDRGPKAQE